jgi:hypothetical protein
MEKTICPDFLTTYQIAFTNIKAIYKALIISCKFD